MQLAVPHGVASMPLEQDTRPVVLAWVNGVGPLRLLVETGSPVSYLNRDAHQRVMAASATIADSVRAGPLRWTNLGLSAVDNLGLADIDGLLGLDAFAPVTLTIDFPGRTLRLSTDTLPVANGRDIVALRKQSVFWAVPFTVDTQTFSAIIDTQSALSLSGSPTLAGALPFTTAPVTVGRARGPTIGDVAVQRARVATSARFGDLTLEQPIVELMPIAPMLPQNAFILGLQVLGQLELSLDQRTQRARLARADRVIPPPPPVHVAGFTSSRQRDGTRRVSSVLPASAAQEAGVRAGDHVVQINGVSPGELTDAAWNALVTGPNALQLVVRRAEQTVSLSLRPRPIGF
ncbi:MAG: PDZ domain-containing protein [Gemmatimonadetes bacterium]|nr:PDZ domain-containing protein [Gemmatimonadota bacterium]